MQLSARETAVKSLPADLPPANASFVFSVSAFNRRRHGVFAWRMPAKLFGSPLKSAPAASRGARMHRAAVTIRRPATSVCMRGHKLPLIEPGPERLGTVSARRRKHGIVVEVFKGAVRRALNNPRELRRIL